MRLGYLYGFAIYFLSIFLKVKIRSVRLDAVAKIGWRRPIYVLCE